MAIGDKADIFADRHRSVAERVAALDRLGTDLPRAVWKVLGDETEDLAVRLAAIRAIGRTRGAINQLARGFHPPALRQAAVAELERLAQRGLEPYDEKALRADLQQLDRDPGVYPLINLGNTFGRDPRVLRAARRAAKDPRPDIRSVAFSVLAQVGEIDDILAGAGDSSSNVRAQVAYLIGFYSLGRREDLTTLERLATDADDEVRANARAAMRRLGAMPLSTGKKRRMRAGDQVWVTLLGKLAAKVLANREMAVDLPDEAVQEGWLGGAGASAAELEKVEARLGVTLPPSYRAFLQASNGWGPTSFAIDRLLTAAEIVRFAESEPDWVEIWKDSEESTGLRSALQVSTVTDNGVCLLVPSEGEEWEAWLFANWIPGAHRHESFLAFMRSELDNP